MTRSGKDIQQLRKLLGLTTKEFAAEIGYDDNYLRQIEAKDTHTPKRFDFAIEMFLLKKKLENHAKIP